MLEGAEMKQRYLHYRFCRMNIIKVVFWILMIITAVSSTVYITETANKDMTSSSYFLYSVNTASLSLCSLYCELKGPCSSFTFNSRNSSSSCVLYSSKNPTFDVKESGRQHYKKQFEVDSCDDIPELGYYNITKNGITMRVFCHDGWTYVQRRLLPEKKGEFFKTDIGNYAQGFGDYHRLTYWIGNDKLHLLTKDGDYLMQVYFAGANNSFYVLFEHFLVASYHEKYRLTIGGMILQSNDEGVVFQEMLSFDGMEFYTTGFGDPAPASSNFFNGGGWWKPNGSVKTCLNCYDSQGVGQIRYGKLQDKFGSFVKSAAWKPIDLSANAEGSIIVSVLQKYKVPMTGVIVGRGMKISDNEKNCLSIYQRYKHAATGIYTIKLDDNTRKSVYCEMAVEGGGWTVFQRRYDGSQDFYKGWADYKAGFGNVRGEYWLGNDALHQLTKDGSCTLRINMINNKGESGYAKYSNFTVAAEKDAYRMTFQNYLGGVGDSLSYHKGHKFSTKDRDNDKSSRQNCSVGYLGAWWYNQCHQSNLNGKYGGTTDKNIRWHKWHGKDSWPKATMMMVKC